MVENKQANPAAISDELFSELKSTWNQLRNDVGENSVEGPFVPFVGRHYWDPNKPRIMYVGKATAGWEKNSHYTIEERRSQTSDFIEQEVAPKKYSSAFWRFLLGLTREFFRTIEPPVEDSPAWALDHLVWTNLMKIAVTGTQPRGAAAALQRDLAGRLLRYELATLRPSAVLLVTNNYEGQLVKRVFETSWDKLPGVSEPWTWVGDLPEIPSRVYWTRHPQGWETASRDNEMAMITSDFQDFWSSHSR